jgi:hypothetical protein
MLDYLVDLGCNWRAIRAAQEFKAKSLKEREIALSHRLHFWVQRYPPRKKFPGTSDLWLRKVYKWQQIDV